MLTPTSTLGAQDTLSREEKSVIIKKLNEVIYKNYIYDDKVRAVAARLNQNLDTKSYKNIQSRSDFARKLTEELINETGDLHFMVGVDPKWVTQQQSQTNSEQQPTIDTNELEHAQQTNFGFKQIKILEGKVGYVRFDYFANPEIGAQTAAAAMQMVENTDALIFDLRYNNGGYLEMAQFLMSYLFSPGKDQLFFDYFYNEDGQRVSRGQWLLPSVPGKRRPNVPVYILTSCTSFSSAEWFSFSLKKLGRATIVGETTAGGAHPVDRKVVDDYFFVQIPIGEIKDPVDRQDFEGMGVEPDHKVIASNALTVAHQMAVKQLATADKRAKLTYHWLTPLLKSRTHSPTVAKRDLEAMVGQYEGRSIYLNNDTLYYRWRDRYQLALTPITPNLFSVEGISDFRFQFLKEDGKISALKKVKQDGTHQLYKRL